MLLGNRFPAPVQDAALLVARVLLGVVFIAHGWQKFNEFGLEGTGQAFDAMGVPLPQAAAVFAATVELAGGALLVLGLVTPVAVAFLVVDMLGAFVIVHRSAGVFVAANGWELVAALGAGALVIGAVGPGRYALDALLSRRGVTEQADQELVAR